MGPNLAHLIWYGVSIDLVGYPRWIVTHGLFQHSVGASPLGCLQGKLLTFK